MVADPAEYQWSSYQVNALGRETDLCTPHELYLRLGKETAERLENYRSLFKCCIDDELLNEIRKSTQQGMAIGNEQFKLDIEKLTGRRMRTIKMGRPSRGNV